jgi:uncharacterized protein YjiS (DUF1127 family)
MASPALSDAGRLVAQGVAAFAGALAAGLAWRRTIRELQELDDRMLRDIGLRRGDVEQAVRFGQQSP